MMCSRVLLASAAMAGAIVVLSQISRRAQAGGTVCNSIGPDVVVGVITGPSNYSSSGGIEAFAIGTTSCNIGDQFLNWFANSTQHPVIGQNLFRLKDGRFEQIGQAWLKHGFFALQGDACSCGCTIPGDGNHLGVGCSDPYSSGLNGGQDGMGPKFEVNAYTGAFLWPATDFSNTGSSTYKRLQAKISDLDPAQDGGGDYFVEAHYVTPDDSAWGNQYNNVSYRTCSITGGGSSWSMSLTGVTQREMPAIEAWRAADPAVSITTVDVPGDGRLYLGWKVTDLGGGSWDYELALYNMNMDRSVGDFHVFFPNGTIVSSTGFHDVDYHSGEPYGGTDWTTTVFADEVAWETQTFSQNQDANALRWGTLYNFRFVADAPPQDVTQAEIGLFKPGSPSSILVDLIPDALANDNCANAIAVSSGTTNFSTLNATTDGPDEPALCTFFAYSHVESDIWYRYTAPCTGDVTVSLCGSLYDTKLAVYVGACPTGSGEAIACNDDFCALQSEVSFAATAGEEFYIRIGGFEGAQGSGTMTIDCGGVIEDNDLCQDALPISDGSIRFDTTGANTDGAAHGSCQFDGQTYHDIWYDYVAQCDGTLTATTCEQLGGSASYDTDLVVYEGCDCGTMTLLGCNDDDPANPCGGGPNYHSTVQVGVMAGQCYKIRAGGWQAGDQGTGTLNISCVGTPFVDCNGNGVHDPVDIANGTSQDCNANAVPDECDIDSGFSQDCAGGPVGVFSDGVIIWNNKCFACHGRDGSGDIGPDIRDYTRVQILDELGPPVGTHSGGQHPEFTQQDFADLEAFLDTIGGSGGRPDLIPDECQALVDCDRDGTPDACELEAGTQVDLDYDGIPDECEVTGACCVDASCSIETEADCTAIGGVWQGTGTGCVPNPCGGEIINLATADYATDSGSISGGSYLDTQAQDDVYEALREQHTGGPPSNRRSLLDHTWTFNVAAGASYSFFVDTFHTANNEGDDFAFSYSLDDLNYAPMLTVTKTADDDVLQSFAFVEDIAGVVFVRVEDTDRTPGNSVRDTIFVDEMFIVTATDGGDITPPSAPTGLTAIGGDGSVTLDWLDNTEPDLDGYDVYRSTTSGGPYDLIALLALTSDYADTAVINGTTYFYVVTAVDLSGNESADSNEAPAMPQPPGGPATTMYVDSIVLSIQNAGGGNKHGRANVTIVDNFGNAVAAALVTGTFSGDYNETQSATTDSSGVATILTTSTLNGNPHFTFCVDDVAGASLIYSPAANVETCDTR